ncbi:MAG: hypothetical protein EPN21_20160 [Methylococcaceae bacterium]|nr:MAG: hypothetical protein EPN21_20160 [Methylococcaceae bacterium]
MKFKTGVPCEAGVVTRDTAAIVADLHDLAQHLLHDDGLILSRVGLLVEAADRLDELQDLVEEPPCAP